MKNIISLVVILISGWTIPAAFASNHSHDVCLCGVSLDNVILDSMDNTVGDDTDNTAGDGVANIADDDADNTPRDSEDNVGNDNAHAVSCTCADGSQGYWAHQDEGQPVPLLKRLREIHGQ